MTEHAMSTRYEGPRCHPPQYDAGEMRAAGGLSSKICDGQNRRFTTVTCQRCRHTELFAVESSKLGTVFDFFTG
jgi:hypothetical protein